MPTDLFTQITNALLDLQASHFQTYGRSVRNLARLLQHEDLKNINAKLKRDLDLESFLKKGLASQSSMVGSAHLVWPERHEDYLGLVLLLIEKFGQNPDEMLNFGHTFCYSGAQLIGDIHAVTRQILIPFVRDYKTYVHNSGSSEVKLIMPKSPNIFIVHGHDNAAKLEVALFLTSLGFNPIILNEQPDRGKTVIEKLEHYKDVGFAVVLLTPDDEGRPNGGVLEPRARQNVLLELGYFMAHLGRENVCALKKGSVEIPSDFAGVIWKPMDAASGWKLALGNELKAAGYQVDMNRLLAG